jgi:transcriptional regulator with XRE-family HTH domain
MTTLSARIHLIHQETGKNFAELARLAGATKSAGQQWKQGDTEEIGSKYAFALQHALGYSAEWIATGNGPKTVKEIQERIKRDAIKEFKESEYFSDREILHVVEIMKSLDPDGRRSVYEGAEKEKRIRILEDALTRKVSGA